MMDGLWVVDKPAGCTSHDVVATLRRASGQRRIGHGGTLDPDATGVLLVGAGRATRLLRFVQEQDKAYTAEVVFGVATDTLDASGSVLERAPMAITRDEVAAATAHFVGEIDQVPPMVSAIKVGGRRLHELARAGEEVERAPRRVHVARFDVESFEPGPYPVATVTVECGSGTYVRSLVADLGAALGGYAHVRALRRTRIGTFGLGEARPLAEIEADPVGLLRPVVELVRHLERVDVDAATAEAVAHGAVFTAGAFAGDAAGAGPFAVVDPAGELLAVYERRGAALKPAVVVAPRDAGG